MTLRFLASLSLIVAASSFVMGCAADSSSSSSDPSNGSSSSGGAERAIAEADIIQVGGGRLYAMSKSGTLSVVDVSVPGRLALLGQTRLPGQPFEMYRRGDLLLAMSNGAVSTSGVVASPSTSSGASVDPDAGSALIALDVRNPAQIRTMGTFVVPGEVADSRVVGDVLYLATYENARCFKCGAAPRTMVTSFDVADPAAVAKIDQVSFQSNAPDGYNLPWGSHWKRSIFVTDQRLYIGGHADIEPSALALGTQPEGIIDVLDISDPRGRLVPGARLRVAGALLSRWQIDEKDGILRVVSQKGAGRTGNGIGMPEVVTFAVVSARELDPLGATSIKLPRQEGLRAVRFDGPRAYAITYNQTDPLFTIDLSNPLAPRVRGELFMPGFMFHLEPHGDRVIGLGLDRTDRNGSLNVSLFDVADMDHPKMIKRVAFGPNGISEDYAILNYEIPEDQDRIQKAFRVFEDGLVVAPFTAATGSFGGSTCANPTGGVQLVAWANDTLVKLPLLQVPGNPRRAFQLSGQLLAVSDSNVRSFDGQTFSQTADLVIGACTNDSASGGYGGPYNYGSRRRSYCSVSNGMTGSETAGGVLGFALIGVAAAIGRRRGQPRDKSAS